MLPFKKKNNLKLPTKWIIWNFIKTIDESHIHSRFLSFPRRFYIQYFKASLRRLRAPRFYKRVFVSSWICRNEDQVCWSAASPDRQNRTPSQHSIVSKMPTMPNSENETKCWYWMYSLPILYILYPFYKY